MNRRWMPALAAAAIVSLAAAPARPTTAHPATIPFPAAVDALRSGGGVTTEAAAWPAPDPIDDGPQVDDPSAGRITTVAGGSAPGGDALDSTFFQPYGAVAGTDGTIYLADTYDNQIKAIDPRTRAVTVIAGTGDAGWSGDGGPAQRASFNFPMGVTIGPNGALYVADTWNDRIRRIDPRSGAATTVAGNGPNDATGRACTDTGGPARAAVISEPHSLAARSDGSLLVADTGCDVIEQVTPDGRITVIAGIEGRSGTGRDGPATASPLANPSSVAVDPLGNAVVADGDSRILYINLQRQPVTVFPASARPLVVGPGARTTIAGATSGAGADEGSGGPPGDGGPARSAHVHPQALGFGADGGLLLADADRRVRRIDWSTGGIRTVAGDGAQGAAGEGDAPERSPLSYPASVFGGGGSGFVVVERGNSRVRSVDTGHSAFTLAGRPDGRGAALGDGLPARSAQLDWPRGVAAGPRGVYVADSYGLRIRRINADGSISTVVGTGPPCIRFGVASDDCGARLPLPAAAPAAAFPLAINFGTGLAASPGALVAFVDLGQVYVLNDSNRTVTLFSDSKHPFTVPIGAVQRVAGGGDRPVPAAGGEPAPESELNGPAGLTFTDHHELLISEQLADRIDRIDLTTGEISVVAGGPGGPGLVDGPATGARFRRPAGIASAPGGIVYVADTGNNAIRRIDRSRRFVATVAGSGVAGFHGDGGPALVAEFADPTDVAVGTDGSVFVVDWGNERIRRIDRDGIIRTFAGNGPTRVGRICGSTIPCGHYAGDGGFAPEGSLYLPLDGASFEAIGPGPRLYIADTMNNRIRAVTAR